MSKPSRTLVLTSQPGVFWASLVLVALFVGLGVGMRQQTAAVASALLEFGTHTGGPLLSVSVLVMLVGAVALGLSPLGRLRLGKPHDRPEFSTLTWFAMLFSAGMGIGLLFYGVAEPVTHYAHPPTSEAFSPQAARDAMGIALFHWGLHAWGIYAVVALALGYRCYALGEPLSVRMTLRPILGRLVDGPLGQCVDILAVFATIFGLATSLGLGAKQINGGLHQVFGLEISSEAQVVIITLVTLVATASVVSGLKAGVRRLSELNMLLAALLLGFVLLLGSTGALLLGFFENLGSYARIIVQRSLTFGDTPWQSDWTLFYWAWWIAWSPFVGTFIARISKGRSVRELVFGVLLVPSALGALWFTVMGNSALELQSSVGGLAAVVDRDASLAIYALLERFPLASITQPLAVVLVITFFVTSSDSGSLVVDMLTSGGNVEPPVWQRIFWAITEGAVAATLLSLGGLKALQSAAISVGVPFSVVLLLMLIALTKQLTASYREGQPAA